MKLTESQFRKFISREVRRVLREDQGDEEKISTKLDISKGPTAALAFLNGPGADPRVRALLNAGKKDGAPSDEAAKVTTGAATIGELVPTQVEIELTKSIAYPLSDFASMKKMISGGVQRIGAEGNDMIVKSGNLIIDGHHRWSSLFSVAGPEGKIAAIDVGMPESDAASVLAATQVAIAATLTNGEPVPKAKAGGMNILGKGKDELFKLIMSAAGKGGEGGEILSEDFVKQCMEDAAVAAHFKIDASASPEDAKKKIIATVAANLSQMNQPAAGAPPRVDMPQLDKAKGGVKGVLSKIASGEVNYKAPFKDKGTKTKQESVQRGNLVERWQRIAGLVK